MSEFFRKFYPRIWKDEKFRRLSSDHKLITIYTFTGQSNRIGLFPFSPGMAAEDLETLPVTFKEGFLNVCLTLNWEWDDVARVLFIPTWWRYNQPENANNLIGNLKDLADVPETPLLERFLANTKYLRSDLHETFFTTIAKRYPEGSLKRSPSQKQKQKQKQEQEKAQAPADEGEFEHFWETCPKRNGKRVGKPEALRKFLTLTPEDRILVAVAARNYAASELVRKGIGIKDPHRFLQNGKGDQPWRDWITPEEATTGQAVQTCTKRVQHAGDSFLRPCGLPASPESRSGEPRCPEHLRPIITQQVSCAAH